MVSNQTQSQFEVRIDVPSLLRYTSNNEKALKLRWKSKGGDGTLYYFEEAPDQLFKLTIGQDDEKNRLNLMTVYVAEPPRTTPEWVETYLAGYQAVLQAWGNMTTVVRYVYATSKEHAE